MAVTDLLTRRYIQQVQWTRKIREYIFSRLDIKSGMKILEVGCGSGALAQALLDLDPTLLCGVDYDPVALKTAIQVAARGQFTYADGRKLPFDRNLFDMSVCHFFLLWCSNPAAALLEMTRVTRSGGVVIALAEPDYGGRIDHPASLEGLGRLQAEALAKRGADPKIGRKLAGLLSSVGLKEINFGVLGGQWIDREEAYDTDEEWAILREDLRGIVDESSLDNLFQTEITSIKNGERVLYVPIFYGWGRVD